MPTFPRHPVVLAQQALTTQAATDGRLALGIGLSHQLVIEGMYGYSFDKPVRHMREYLEILIPLIQAGNVSFSGETLTARAGIEVNGAVPCPVLLAALGTKMLQLAGGVADGTVTWMTGPATIEAHIAPTITAAAAGAGRPAPRIGVGLPVCLTTDVDGARERAARTFEIYGSLPSYRAMLDREGAAGPADVAVVGDEAAIRQQVSRLEAGGATDLVANVFGSGEERASDHGDAPVAPLRRAPGRQPAARGSTAGLVPAPRSGSGRRSGGRVRGQLWDVGAADTAAAVVRVVAGPGRVGGPEGCRGCAVGAQSPDDRCDLDRGALLDALEESDDVGAVVAAILVDRPGGAAVADRAGAGRAGGGGDDADRDAAERQEEDP